MEKEEKAGRGCFEGKSISENQAFRVMMESGRGHRFLVGDAMYIFSCCDL